VLPHPTVPTSSGSAASSTARTFSCAITPAIWSSSCSSPGCGTR